MEIKLTKKEKEKMVCDLYLDGLTYEEIIKELGYKSKTTVYYIILKHGLCDKYISYSDEIIDQIIEGWRDRKSCKQIGMKLRISGNNVRNQLRKLCLVD